MQNLNLLETGKLYIVTMDGGRWARAPRAPYLRAITFDGDSHLIEAGQVILWLGKEEDPDWAFNPAATNGSRRVWHTMLHGDAKAWISEYMSSQRGWIWLKKVEAKNDSR